VIAILAVLAVVVVVTLNPTGLLQESRDTNRLSDIATLNSAISLFAADVQTTNALGTVNTVYVSIPDAVATTTAGDQCQGLGLPTLPSAYVYQCAASSTYRLTNGTGWIPASFSQASFGAPLAKLPTDPMNSTSSGLYYTYVTNGTQYEVNAILESQKYKSQFAQNPQITDYPEVVGQGSNLTLNPLWNASGLVGWWPLTEGTGTTAYDQSGNGNAGNWSGTMTGTNGYYSGGKVGAWAGAFDGSTDYVTLPSSTLHETVFTVAAWVDPTNLRNSNDLILGDYNSGATRANYVLSIDRSGSGNGSTPYIFFYSNSGIGTTAEDSIAVSNKTWVYLAGTFDGSALKLYRNGLLATSTASSNVPSNQGGSMDIGKSGDYTGNLMFQGFIGDVRIYNRALSAAEVQALYNAEK
jgi:hypothetical protein